MAQLAMKQSMDEITDYLATIDEKVDDVLRAQKDAVLADMNGVGSVIDDAIITRDHTGRVSAVTWSKVQGWWPSWLDASNFRMRSPCLN